MTPFRIIIALVVFFAFVGSGFSQTSHEDAKKALSRLEGIEYEDYAFEAARQLVEIKAYEDALDIMDKAVKKSRSRGNVAYATVQMRKAQFLVEHFPMNEEYVEETVNSVEKSVKKDKSLSSIQSGFKVWDELKEKTYKEPALHEQIIDLNEFLIEVNREVIEAREKEKVDAVVIKSKKSAAEEIVQLRTERERLENIAENLSQSIDVNEEKLQERKAIIEKMSTEQSENEAVIQFNKRIIDSLKFSAQLDSISILNNRHLINEQKSELQIKEAALELESSKQRLYIAIAILGVLVTCFLGWILYASRKANKELRESQLEIQKEKDRAEKLLLNILPEYIAHELKEKSSVETRMIEQCTVMFTDFINFSSIAKELSPKELIETLDVCFREFDRICSAHNIEKIKTIGDAYMCAGGVPIPNKTHAFDTINAALDMVAFLDRWNNEREKNNKVRFDARIGIHSGSVIAGVVGLKKFTYDIWGDTVNIAARIESKSSAQSINISASTYELTREHFQFENRGKIAVKNMEELNMYYIQHD